ncbi:TetR/AcrR family transcriptional regulator [Emcibacter sp.]|uniref:TetR/AcrR family transcriptional regulator n=1 Tax=Emcibacter sp. TaxID=1979954 RepID=UPI002AA74FD6|nr:TetR/AcrR family transcriptional regulator [Emcibacter sp.]
MIENDESEFSRRKMPKQERALATAEAITQATQQLIIKEGYENATTNRIAKAAGVSVGSLYQYFPNKQAIIKTLIQETVNDAAAQIRNQLRDLMEVPLESALHQIIALLFQIYKENAFILIQIIEYVPEMKDFTKNIKLDIYTYSTNLAFLEQHQDEITVTDYPTALLLIVRSTVHNIECFLTESTTDMTEEQLVNELTRMAVNYLTK